MSHRLLRAGYVPMMKSVKSTVPDGDTTVPMTYIPIFPSYPLETSRMRQLGTKIPALVLRQHALGARSAYLAADIDRRSARDNLPDYGDLLTNLVHWVAKDNIPLRVEGTGLVGSSKAASDN